MSFQSLGHCCNRGEIEVLFNFVSTKLFILRYLYYINPSIILIKLSQKHLKLLPLQNINILLWEDPEGHLFRFFFQKISAALHAMKNILEDILSVSLRNALSCVLNLKKKKSYHVFSPFKHTTGMKGKQPAKMNCYSRWQWFTSDH